MILKRTRIHRCDGNKFIIIIIVRSTHWSFSDTLRCENIHIQHILPLRLPTLTLFTWCTSRQPYTLEKLSKAFTCNAPAHYSFYFILFFYFLFFTSSTMPKENTIINSVKHFSLNSRFTITSSSIRTPIHTHNTQDTTFEHVYRIHSHVSKQSHKQIENAHFMYRSRVYAIRTQ